MDENNNKNLILAVVLSMVVIMGWFVLFPPPEPEVQPQTAELTVPAVPSTGAEVAAATAAAASQTNFANAARLTVDTPRIQGSISLVGGRIDDLSLKDYHETVDKDSPIVRLLAPELQANSFYAVYGWAPAGSLTYADVPGPDTEWTVASGDVLAPGKPVTLAWDNGKGLTFNRSLTVDEHYMFSVNDTVQNNSGGDVSLAPYGQVRRHGLPSNLKGFFILHEGAIQRVDGKLTETSYKDITDLTPNAAEGNNPAELTSVNSEGWIGFTDHYWMTIMVPEAGKPFTAVTKYVPGANVYMTEARQPAVIIPAGGSYANENRLFAGAKEWTTIRDYENDPGFISSIFGTKVDPNRAPIPGFIDSIDWGWFYFLTKPIFAVLHWLNAMIGNMGLAIISLTVILKIIVLPLAYKSYVSMARMKELQPELEALKERAGDDRQKLQKEMMQLYRDKKVNPAAGCLPILIQIPIFFSLYKVIFVTLELRHAPFFGWLKDLSAPDPSSLYNFFGLLPWAVPETGSLLHMIFIGVLPILLGITMWLQQKLNPAPADPTQAAIFAWMPWIFMFMLGGFASGLVVYWIANNIITFVQQYTIMRSHGAKPDIFGNIKKGFAKKPKAELAKKK